jgi:uncharacterized protein
MTIREELLNILVCPACRGKVIVKESFIICTTCQRHYPIRDDIPIMLVNEATIPETPSKQETTG